MLSLEFTKKLGAYVHLMRFHKPIGIWLLLWPILWALWIAGEGHPPVWMVLVFVSGVVVMRATGCVINDIWDRDLDKHVPRTKMRPLATGIITVKDATIVVVILLLIALMLVLSLNIYTLLLAFVGIAGTWLYPLMKRYTYYPQVVLGLVFNWGIILVFSAITHNIPPIAWLLFGATLLWTVAYDTLYAMADRPADIAVGLKSTAILLGDLDIIGVAGLQLLFLLGLVFVGNQLQLNTFYYLGLLAVLGLFVYEWRLIRLRDPDACFAAFNHNNWVGVIVLLSIMAGYNTF